MQQSRKLKNPKRAKLSNNKQTKKKILPTNNNKNKSISNIDKVISTLKLGSVMPNTSSATSNETPYIEAILLPESANNAKIPGLADMSIALHRKLTFNLTTNTLGAAALFFFPYGLSDLSTIGTAGNSSIFFTSPSNLTFDGVTTVGTSNPTASQCNFNITAGSVAQYRCVSASIHIIPQSSVLNQAGSIHASLLPLPAQFLMNPSGALSSVVAQACLIPTLSNTPHYSEASVSAMEGMRVIWLPNDECLLEFANINTSAASDNSNSCFNAMVATIVGTVPASLFRIDCYMNYEIVPTPTSVLVGMETICTHNERPQSIWRNILLKHADDICKPVKSSKVTASSVGLLGSKMDLLKKFIGN